MRSSGYEFRGALLLVGLLAGGKAAQATECGTARRQVEQLKAAIAVDESARRGKEVAAARAKLQSLQATVDRTCTTKRATIIALPLGYVTLPEGNASKSEITYSENWEITLTTQAGARHGIAFNTPATVTSAWGTKITADEKSGLKPGETLVAVALGASLVVEEPRPGEGTWKIALAAPPTLIPATKLRACADGKLKLEKLTPFSCEVALSAYPLPFPDSVPGRGRAVYVGEWQYGWQAGHVLVTETMGGFAESKDPVRFDLELELDQPLGAITTGLKRLPVTIEGNRQASTDGVTITLGHTCNDDEACEKKHFAAEIWWDRVFAMPILRQPQSVDLVASGKVTDRLAKPIAGQRLLLEGKGRRIITSTNKDGEYRFTALGGGEYTLYPVGKSPTNLLKGGEEKRTVQIGFAEAKLPVLFLNRLHE